MLKTVGSCEEKAEGGGEQQRRTSRNRKLSLEQVDREMAVIKKELPKEVREARQVAWQTWFAVKTIIFSKGKERREKKLGKRGEFKSENSSGKEVQGPSRTSIEGENLCQVIGKDLLSLSDVGVRKGDSVPGKAIKGLKGWGGGG